LGAAAAQRVRRIAAGPEALRTEARSTVQPVPKTQNALSTASS
jgi:hypothetical protein